MGSHKLFFRIVVFCMLGAMLLTAVSALLSLAL